jgi:pimeloyl-ACP methyl ester carboxylesterase
MMANLLRAAVLGALLAALLAGVLGIRHGQPGIGIGVAILILGGVAPVLALQFVLMHAVNRRGQGLMPGHDAHVRPPPRARIRQLVSAWWHELLTFVAVFVWRQPFRSRAVADVPDGTRPLPGLGTERPLRGVVLIHGYCCNRGLWNPWLEQLRARAIPAVAVDLEPVFGSIDAYAPTVEAAVRAMERSTGRPPVLVGHSMGGLAIRAWLRRAGPGALERVHHVVTIGSPHHGTWLGRAGHTTNARQMRLGSPWLQALAADETPGQWQRFTCFWSHCDNIVFPASSATLPGADNRHLEAVAHVDLVNRREVLAEVLARAGEPACSRSREPAPPGEAMCVRPDGSVPAGAQASATG